MKISDRDIELMIVALSFAISSEESFLDAIHDEYSYPDNYIPMDGMEKEWKDAMNNIKRFKILLKKLQKEG